MTLKPVGDTAILAVFENEISVENNDRVHALCSAVASASIAGVVEMIPTYTSLTVIYDPTVIGYDELCSAVLSLEKSGGSQKRTSFVYTIPVCYGGELGADLSDVAAHAGIGEDEVVRRHTAVCYRIYMLGFLPGFAYLGGLDESIACPRLTTPRTVIPAGSVGIGGKQTGVYPVASPGGWRLIGTTPLKLYDPSRADPIIYRAGDHIRFTAVCEREFELISKDVASGTYKIAKEELK